MKKSELKSIIMECIEEMEHGMGKLVKKFDKSQDKFKKAKKAGGDPTDPSMSPKLYKDYQNAFEILSETKELSDERKVSNTKDLNDEREIRKRILEELFAEIDPSFISELQNKHEELRKNMIKKESQARLLVDFLKGISLVLVPLIFILSVLIWGFYMYGHYLINAAKVFQTYLIDHSILVILVLVLVIVTAVLYSIAIRRNKISGSLIFMDGSTTIAEFGMYSGTNTRKIKRRDLDGFPQLTLKSIVLRNAGGNRHRVAQLDDSPLGSFSNDEQSIIADCISSSGRRFVVELYPHTPTIYSEETFAQMVYEPVE